MMRRWHILTPELPPECGGVGDYTAQVAESLAHAGDSVSVYSPPSASHWHSGDGIESVTLADCFGPESQRLLTARLDRDLSSRLLVQYVPAVFGSRGANVSFCRWVRSWTRAGADIRVMFHEPYLYLRWRPDHILTAFAQRSMARTLLDGVPIVYLSTDTWRRYLSPYGSGAVKQAITLPIPSAIPRVSCPDGVRVARRQSIGTAPHLVGHFGTYGRHVAPLLRRTVYDLFSSDSSVAVLCTGAGSESFVERILVERPDFRDRLTGTGRASVRDVSLNLQACDVLVQPYPDGVTTRRTSVMAGLANGRAVVTTNGPLTEEIWRETGCVSLTRSTAALVSATRDLLANATARMSLEERAVATYTSKFDLRHTIDALRGVGPQGPSA
jgi:glycosyltransferase involved in cell wall biosynthesis